MAWLIRFRWPLMIIALIVAVGSVFYSWGRSSRDEEIRLLTADTARCKEAGELIERQAQERADTARKTVIRYRTVYRDRKPAVDAVLTAPRDKADESNAADLLLDYHAVARRLRDAQTDAGASAVR